MRGIGKTKRWDIHFPSTKSLKTHSIITFANMLNDILKANEMSWDLKDLLTLFTTGVDILLGILFKAVELFFLCLLYWCLTCPLWWWGGQECRPAPQFPSASPGLCPSAGPGPRPVHLWEREKSGRPGTATAARTAACSLPGAQPHLDHGVFSHQTG